MTTPWPQATLRLHRNKALTVLAQKVMFDFLSST